MKRITTYIIMLVALVSCSNDEVININKDIANSNALRFQAMPTVTSRAAVEYTNKTLDDLLVYAYYGGYTTSTDNAGDVYIKDMELTKVTDDSGSNTYEYQPTDNTTNQYVWPFKDETLNFFCFSNPEAASYSENDSELTYFESLAQPSTKAYSPLVKSFSFTDMTGYTETEIDTMKVKTDERGYYLEESKYYNGYSAIGFTDVNEIAKGLAKKLTLNVYQNSLQKKQHDLVYAVTGNIKKSYNNGSVPLYFKHALAKVKFNISVSNQCLLVKLYGINLRNVANDGKLTIFGPTCYYSNDGTSSLNLSSPEESYSCIWEQPATDQDYNDLVKDREYSIDYSYFKDDDDSRTYTNQMYVYDGTKFEADKNYGIKINDNTNNVFYVIPHNYKALTIPVTDNDYGMFLDLDFQLFNLSEDTKTLVNFDETNGVLLTDAKTHIQKKEDLSKVTTRIPLGANWLPGHEYTYHIYIGSNSFRLTNVYNSEGTTELDLGHYPICMEATIDNWATQIENASTNIMNETIDVYSKK